MCYPEYSIGVVRVMMIACCENLELDSKECKQLREQCPQLQVGRKGTRVCDPWVSHSIFALA